MALSVSAASATWRNTNISTTRRTLATKEGIPIGVLAMHTELICADCSSCHWVLVALRVLTALAAWRHASIATTLAVFTTTEVVTELVLAARATFHNTNVAAAFIICTTDKHDPLSVPTDLGELVVQHGLDKVRELF
jgi:hypothetical protein